jgi:RNA polymerase sigma factor (TIGR02999 family)
MWRSHPFKGATHLSRVTHILSQIESGDPSAAEQLLPLVYEELRTLAARELSHERADQTLQATDLVHEAYLRLVGKDQEQKWSHRGHFYCAAAQAMRRILIDSARRKQARKRGGSGSALPLNESIVPEVPEEFDLLSLDKVLTQLEQEQPELAKLVSLRYFAGLTMPQTAQALGIPLRTAERKWTYVKAWLLEALAQN